MVVTPRLLRSFVEKNCCLDSLLPDDLIALTWSMCSFDFQVSSGPNRDKATPSKLRVAKGTYTSDGGPQVAKLICIVN